MVDRTRTLRLLLSLILGCILAPSIAQAQAKPAQKTKLTQRKAQDLLRAGYDALQERKARDAAENFSKALKSGLLSSSEIAKAFYYRAQAYRSLNQPANAISDLNSALWMKGELSDNDRTEALKMRDAAYREAGVAGVASRPANRTASQNTSQAGTPSAQTSSWQTSATQQPAAQQSPATTSLASRSPISSFFGSLFGGNQAKKTTPAKAAGNAATSSSAWAAATQTVPSASGARAEPARVSGAYTIQVASVRNEALARNIVRQITSQHTQFLRGRQPTVERQAVGNMGTFYHVRIKQWPSKQASRQLCKRLLETGLDCLVSN